MEKNCLLCGNVYTKRWNESKNSWETRHKYCSRECANKAKIGRSNSSKTRFIKGDPRLIGNKIRVGMTPWNKGKHWSDKIKSKISKTLTGRPTGRTGPKCNFWKGGKTKWRQELKNSIEYKNWRRKVFERDGYTCQKCGDRNYSGRGLTIELHPHHIKSVREFPEISCELSNGITLCKDCHMATETWGRPS